MSDPSATFGVVYFVDGQSFPPEPQYEDLPPWHPDDNFDNVRKRTINAAWDMLLTRDLSRIRFRQLAKVSCVTPPAVYHYFKDHDALGADLAVRSAIKLRKECNAAACRDRKAYTRYIRTLFEFARKRPNHFALITSARFGEHPAVEDARKQIYDDLEGVLHHLLRRSPTQDERAAMRVHVLGGASMVAAKIATAHEVLTGLVATFRTWRRATRHKGRRGPNEAAQPTETPPPEREEDLSNRSFPEYPGESPY
jgi:AcrR family transcriptional regulator